MHNSINTELISLELTFSMKLHERLFFLRHIAMGRDGMEKVFHYLEDNLPATFSHPLKTMEDCDMLSFLHGSSASIFGVLEPQSSFPRVRA